jgi:hypothetical protein
MTRQFVKYLPFRKLQPPRKIKGFAVPSHSFLAPHGAVLQILSTNWPQVSGPMVYYLNDVLWPNRSLLYSFNHCSVCSRARNALEQSDSTYKPFLAFYM